MARSKMFFAKKDSFPEEASCAFVDLPKTGSCSRLLAVASARIVSGPYQGA